MDTYHIHVVSTVRSIETPIVFMIGVGLSAISAPTQSQLLGPFRQAEIHFKCLTYSSMTCPLF